MLEHQNEHLARDFLKFSHFVASKSMFSHELALEAQKLQLPSIFTRSQKMPRLPRIFLHLGTTLRSPDNDSQKSCSMTSLKCRAYRARGGWRSPKCSVYNNAKCLYLPHKMILDMLRNTSECHEVPRETKLWKFPNGSK